MHRFELNALAITKSVYARSTVFVAVYIAGYLRAQLRAATITVVLSAVAHYRTAGHRFSARGITRRRRRRLLSNRRSAVIMLE